MKIWNRAAATCVTDVLNSWTLGATAPETSTSKDLASSETCSESMVLSTSMAIPVQNMLGEVTLVKASHDTSVAEFKNLVYRALRPEDDELSRKLTVVDLMLGETHLAEGSATLEESGVTPDTPVLVVFGTRCVECVRREEAPSSLTNRGKALQLIIPHGTIEVPKGAFRGCDAVHRVFFPNSVTTIGSRAFSRCRSLTGVTMPDSLVSIGDGAFAMCEALSSLNLPNSVSSVGGFAFKQCTALKSAAISCSMTTIGRELFKECIYLKSVTIPGSVTMIEEDAFRGCLSLTSLTIPCSVTGIGASAFLGCRSLRSVIIPNSVINIGQDAFSECSSLTSLEIPSSVTDIGAGAFNGCSSLLSLTLPPGLHLEHFHRPPACEISHGASVPVDG